MYKKSVSWNTLQTLKEGVQGVYVHPPSDWSYSMQYKYLAGT